MTNEIHRSLFIFSTIKKVRDFMGLGLSDTDRVEVKALARGHVAEKDLIAEIEKRLCPMDWRNQDCNKVLCWWLEEYDYCESASFLRSKMRE